MHGLLPSLNRRGARPPANCAVAHLIEALTAKARQCGTITISDHFKAWADAGLALGGLLEAKILVETGGGTGSIDFPVANVTKSQ